MALSLSMSRLQVAARMQRLCALIPELASVVATEGIHVGGYVAHGARAAGDIDVLLREHDAERAAALLGGRGFRVAEVMTANHHRPPLQDEQGRVVELHTHLPGLKGPSARRFASFETLEDAGGLEPAPGLGEACHLLRRARPCSRPSTSTRFAWASRAS